MIINSLNNDKVKNWTKLKQKKYREETGLFLVEGMHLISEAYKKGCLEELIVEKDENVEIEINTTYVTKDIINSLTSLDTPVQAIGVCHKANEVSSLGNRILVLDGIQDPGNVGTMVRSAVAFNVDTIVLGNNTVDIYNSKCIRASQGMLFYVNFIERDLLTFLPTIKEEYHILGTNVNNGKDLKELKSADKYAIIMGNEGSGMNPNLEPLCDDLVYIKINKECESLNVAIACSIILYQLSE